MELNHFINIARASEDVLPEEHKKKINVFSEESKQQVYLEESKQKI